MRPSIQFGALLSFSVILLSSCASSVGDSGTVRGIKRSDVVVNGKKVNRVEFNVPAGGPAWHPSTVYVGAGETATITATGAWGVVDPKKQAPCPAAGNGVTAGPGYVLPGVPEGALLIKDGSGQVQAYGNGPAVVKVQGEIQFLANDRAATLPPLGKGWGDNQGALDVVVAVRE